MRQDLVFKFRTSVDVYDAVPVFDDLTGNTTVNYEFNRADKAYLVQSPNSTYMTTRDLIPRFSAVRNILDRKGQALSAYPQLFVTDVIPELDITGAVMAWKHTLRPDLPRNYIKELSDFIESAID